MQENFGDFEPQKFLQATTLWGLLRRCAMSAVFGHFWVKRLFCGRGDSVVLGMYWGCCDSIHSFILWRLEPLPGTVRVCS